MLITVNVSANLMGVGIHIKELPHWYLGSSFNNIFGQSQATRLSQTRSNITAFRLEPQHF